MSLQVEWFPRALDDLLNLRDWRVAETIDAAVNRYAAQGIGFILRVAAIHGPDEHRLLVPGMRTYVRVRRSPSTLYVERVIYRA